MESGEYGIWYIQTMKSDNYSESASTNEEQLQIKLHILTIGTVVQGENQI